MLIPRRDGTFVPQNRYNTFLHLVKVRQTQFEVPTGGTVWSSGKTLDFCARGPWFESRR